MPPVHQGDAQQAQKFDGMDDAVAQRRRVDMGIMPEPTDGQVGQQRDARRGGPAQKAPAGSGPVVVFVITPPGS